MKEDNRYLQDELDERRRAEDERYARERQERDARREERKQEYQESLSYAEDWQDAFSKGKIRFGYEANMEASDFATYGQEPNQPPFDFYFTNELKAIERAEILYAEETVTAQPEIEKLEAQIEEIRQTARNKVAERLESEFPKCTAKEALRENRPDYLVAW